MQRQRQRGEGLAHLRGQRQHLARMRHAGGIGQHHAVYPQRHIALGKAQHPFGRHIALERTAKGGRQRTCHARAAATQRRENFAKALERGIGAAPHVGAVMRLGHRNHQIDLVGARLERPLRTAHIGDQRDVADGRVTPYAGHDLGRIGKIRHRLGRHKRGHLDLGQTGLRQRIDERNLLRRGHKGRFDLQSVSRHHIMDVETTARRLLF